MSYKLCFFAAPASDPLDAVLDRLSEIADELRFENGHEEIYAVTNTEADAQRCGLRLIHLLASPALAGRVSRDFFIEWYNAPLFIAVHDDQHGIFLWQYNNPGQPTQSILTAGHRVGTRNITLTSDYPQRAFTNAQLDEAARKPEDALTPAEAAALMSYANAITLGLAEHAPSLTRSAFLDLLQADSAWPLLKRASKRKKVKLPPAVAPSQAFTSKTTSSKLITLSRSSIKIRA
jgi:hypothetical protein